LNKTSSCSGEYDIPLTKAAKIKPVAIAQPAIGKKVIPKAMTLAALINNKTN
jgi:hypothetical protein